MPRTASQILHQEFLITRAKILELAAFFDRLDQDSTQDDSLAKLRHACRILDDDASDKAARVQMLFSREYNPSWRDDFAV